MNTIANQNVAEWLLNEAVINGIQDPMIGTENGRLLVISNADDSRWHPALVSEFDIQAYADLEKLRTVSEDLMYAYEGWESKELGAHLAYLLSAAISGTVFDITDSEEHQQFYLSLRASVPEESPVWDFVDVRVPVAPTAPVDYTPIWTWMIDEQPDYGARVRSAVNRIASANPPIPVTEIRGNVDPGFLFDAVAEYGVAEEETNTAVAALKEMLVRHIKSFYGTEEG